MKTLTTAMPVHFLQLLHSTLGELVAEWLGGASVCMCLILCLSAVDVPLRKRVNPLILNQADVLAHHSLSSRPLLPGSLLFNPQPLAKCGRIFSSVVWIAFKMTSRKLSKAADKKTNANTVNVTFALFNLFYSSITFSFLICHNKYLLP